MRALVMREFGPPGVMQLEEVPVPQPAAGELLVRVAAIEVARTRDVSTRGGAHPFSRQVTLPHVLGGDLVGTVEAIGDEVDPVFLGRRVAVLASNACGRCASCRAGRPWECTQLRLLGIHRWGGYADFTTVPVGSAHLLPDSVDFVEAAALAANGPLAVAQLQFAETTDGTVLLPGLSGALATVVAVTAAAIGVRVVGTSRRPELVPDGLVAAVLDPGAPDFEDALRAQTSGGPDAVIDNIGSPALFDRYFPVLRNGARIVISGALGDDGPPVFRVPVAGLYARSIALLGVRTASPRAVAEFWRLVEAGLRLPDGLVRRWRLDDAPAVHELIEAGNTSGHNVLVVDDAAAGAPA